MVVLIGIGIIQMSLHDSRNHKTIAQPLFPSLRNELLSTEVYTECLRWESVLFECCFFYIGHDSILGSNNILVFQFFPC